MPSLQLQFPIGDVEPLAARYDFDVDDDVAAAGSAARERGFYTKPELVLVCEWKTVRSRSRVAQNTAGFVERITGAALATDDERERMAALCVLRGVDVPSASVLLHFRSRSATRPSTGARSNRSGGRSRRRTRSRTGCPTPTPAASWRSGPA